MSPELAHRQEEATQPQQPGTALGVRREPIPQELAKLGVVIGVDRESGMQVLTIPKALRENANVLTPVQAFQQADPNWRPSLRVVEADPSKDGAHFYPQQGGKLAPRKQLLELLADAAGVVDIRPLLLGRERVEVGGVTAETFTHVATAKVRKSDGTLRVLEASRTYEPYAEYEEIKTAVATGQYAKKPGTAEYDAEVRKRWLNEIKFAKAKNESKAILRAIRAVLQIPHTFTATDAAKPFVVVGWNLAPQDTAAVHDAIAALYGASPETIGTRAQIAATADIEDVAPEEIDASEASSQQAPEAATPPAASGVPGDQGSSAAEQPVREPAAAPADSAAPGETGTSPGPAADEPVIEGVEIVEVEAVEEHELTDADQAALPAALAFKIPGGSYQGRTLGWVLELGDKTDEWLAYALRQQWPQDPGFRSALQLVCKAHRHNLYAAWKEEQS